MKDVYKKNLIKIIIFGCALSIVGIMTAIIVVIINNGNKNEDYNYEMSLEEYYNEADKIYNNNPSNLTKVIDFFTKGVKEDSSNVRSVFFNEQGWFYTRNIDNKEMLLDGLTRLDYSNLGDSEVYRIYNTIIDLAKSLGKDELVERYTLLQKEVEEGYSTEFFETQKTMDEYEKEKEQAIEIIEVKVEDSSNEK